MANLDEDLLARQTLNSAEEERRAAGKMREDRGQERLQAAAGGNQLSGDTLEQQQDTARIAEAAQTPAEANEAPSAASAATSKWLVMAWFNMLDPFAIPIALAYINLHVFGHSVFGEKVFCALGEEGIPPNLRTGVFMQKFKDKAKSLGLLEVIGLFLLDAIAFAALLILIAVVVQILNSLPVKIGLWMIDTFGGAGAWFVNIFQ
jgi:hypothetical protein